MLVFSLTLMVFGVFAAAQNTLGVKNLISFDIEDNISCDIDAWTAIGTSSNIAFNDAPENAKNIEASINIDSETITKLSGNSDINSNVWEPWKNTDKALLDLTNDTVFWMFKITNTCGNSIQVRITDIEDKTLFTLNNNLQLIKRFGTSESTSPDQTESGEVKYNETVYVLISLEAIIKTKGFEGDWNFKIHIEKASASYLMTGWKEHIEEEVRDTITNIEFVGGTGEEYNSTSTYNSAQQTKYSFGATDKTGENPLKDNESQYQNVNDITGYLKNGTLTIYSKGKIYAPVDSEHLFENLKNVNAISFENFNTSNVNSMKNMFDNCISLSNVDVSNFDTSNTKNMSGLFNDCSGLTQIDVSNFDTIP